MDVLSIAIFCDYGSDIIPDALAKDLPEDFLQNRIELAKRVKALPFTHADQIGDADYAIFNDTPVTKDDIVYIRVETIPNLVIVKFASIGGAETTIKLVDIDTTTPWKLDDYDGYERVAYQSEPTIIDKESNFSTW